MEKAQQLLDFKQPLDTALLDQVSFHLLSLSLCPAPFVAFSASHTVHARPCLDLPRSGTLQVVLAFYQHGNMEMQKILVPFQNHPDAWTRVRQILEQSKVPHTIQLALSILEKTVQYRWQQLPPDQRQFVKVSSSCLDDWDGVRDSMPLPLTPSPLRFIPTHPPTITSFLLLCSDRTSLWTA